MDFISSEWENRKIFFWKLQDDLPKIDKLVKNGDVTMFFLKRK